MAKVVILHFMKVKKDKKPKVKKVAMSSLLFNILHCSEISKDFKEQLVKEIYDC